MKLGLEQVESRQTRGRETRRLLSGAAAAERAEHMGICRCSPPSDSVATATPWSEAAERFRRLERRPLLAADWLSTVMIHYAVPPADLQPHVPFPLDTMDGSAWVSCVTFRMCNTWLIPPKSLWWAALFGSRIEPQTGRRAGHAALNSLSRLCGGISNHTFLNVRTYVRCNGERGIYFLSEWLPRRLNVLLGPPLFGLPYRWGRLLYDNDGTTGHVAGRVIADGCFEYRGTVDGADLPGACPRGSVDEFLMERYTAFTNWHGIRRCFRILHEPWPQRRLAADIVEDSLLNRLGSWFKKARLSHACHSPGVRTVLIGRPHVIGQGEAR